MLFLLKTLIIITCIVTFFVVIGSKERYKTYYNSLLDDPDHYSKEKEIEREKEKIREKLELEIVCYQEEIEEEYKNCLSIEFQVAGVYYRSEAVKEEIPHLSIYDEIKLSKEPNNQYDRYAVKVMLGRKKAGYVPKELSQFISSLISKRRVEKIIITDAGDNGDIFDPNPYLFIKVFYS